MKKESKSSNVVKKQFGDYLIGKTIGQGTFGKVKSAIHKLTNEHVAIKILEKSKISEVADVERVSRQIHILKLIRHPNIVQLYEIIETPKQLFLIMQYMENGELFDYIVANKRIEQNVACKMFHELIGGIQYIHKIGVVHRDLKPENILIDYKDSLRIVDFGLSNTYKKNQLLKTPCGSPCYAAPEMIKGEKYEGLKVDLWSSGVILFAMLCGYLPFEDPDTPALYKKILSGSYSFHKSLSANAKDLIEKILNGDHTQRYSIEQIRNHPWMKQDLNKNHNQGIIIGFNKIPIEPEILASMKNLSFDPDYVSKCLEANRHNNATTAYYLSLQKHIREGGTVNFDQPSKSFDKSTIPLSNRRRKNTLQNVIIDNLFTKNADGEVVVRKKSKDHKDNKEKSREKDKNMKEDKENKENKYISNLATESKKIKANSKSKINESFNYGRVPLTSKSVERSIHQPRETILENRINRRFKEKFNQSLLTKSKDKIPHQRSRINSSINGCKKEVQGVSTVILEDIMYKNKKMNKKTCSNSIKCDTSKIIRARRL